MHNNKIDNELNMNHDIPMTVYHSTCTGKDLERLKIFKKKGARSDLARGCGQGFGFYVWPSRKAAEYHLNFMEDRIRGFPLLIIIEAKINSQDWDIDFEGSAPLMIHFLIDNFELFQKIPNKLIKYKINNDEHYLYPSKSKYNDKSNQYIILYDKDITNKEIIHFKFNLNEPVNISKAIILSKIFNYLRDHFPTKMREAEIKWFFNIKKSRISDFPIKYVGKKPLRKLKMEAFVNNKWINALELLD